MVFVDIPSYTTNKALSDFDTRLLMFLVCNMNESNEVRLMQDEIAKELDVYQPRVSKSLARLRETNYVTTPRRGVIQISPEFAWRDSLAENAKARSKP